MIWTVNKISNWLLTPEVIRNIIETVKAIPYKERFSFFRYCLKFKLPERDKKEQIIMHNKKIRKLTLTSVLAALTCVATMLIRIPTPTKGYVNLGDCMVNICAWILGPVCGGAAAGFGSAAADILSGYVIYSPATLIIKALMAVFSFMIFNLMVKKLHSAAARIIAASFAEIVMILGYFVFETIIYGSAVTASAGIVGNIFQGVMGTVSSVILYEAVIRRIPSRNI